MADPFSAAGSAVGVVSLGILVCQGLVTYIGDMKDAKERTIQISRQMDELAAHLERLESLLSKMKPSAHIAGVEEGIIACAEAIQKIKDKLGWDASAGGTTFRTQWKDLKQKLWYNFKKGDIAYARGVIEFVEQNLQTALLALILDKQGNLAENISVRLAGQSQLIWDAFASLQENSARTQAIIQCDTVKILASLFPIAASVTYIAKTIPNMEDSLSRLEAKIESLTLHTISSKAVQSRSSDMNTVSRNLKHLKARSLRNRHTFAECSCQRRSKTTVYLHWPISISRTITHIHEFHCPHAVYQAAISDLDMRLLLCSAAFKRKISIALLISQGLGKWSIAPGLCTYRIVSWGSPAFALMDSSHKKLRTFTSSDAWIEPAQELFRLFQTGQASPYERLANGQTLLHYFCQEPYSYSSENGPNNNTMFEENFYQMARRLLQYVDEGAMEMDDHGQTCVDILVRNGTHHRLIHSFLDHGIPITYGDASRYIFHNWEGLISWTTQYPDALECSKLMKAIILKSEDALRNTIDQNEEDMDLFKQDYSLYYPATLFGWERGCEILLEKGVRLGCDKSWWLQLLGCAVMSSNIDVLNFWINIGPELDGDDLYHVGCLEEALVNAARWSAPAGGRLHVLEKIISELVQRRQYLQTIADATSVAMNSQQKATGLLNSHAREVYDCLVDCGVYIQPYLRPLGGNMFGYDYGYLQIPVMDMLYTAGFRNINQDLIFQQVTAERQHGYPMERLIQLCEWFYQKGVDPKAQWPNSRITILHCLAWQFGEELCYNDDLPRKYNVEVFPTLLSACCDSCKCGCSTKGCLPITMMCKSIENYCGWKDDEPLRLTLEAISAWSLKSADMRSPEYKWFVTAFIRVVTFWKLGIRHSCCDLNRIQHGSFVVKHSKPFHPHPSPIRYPSEDIHYNLSIGGYRKPFDPHSSPVRYSPKDICKIRKEDAFLLDLLEQLMQKFEFELNIFEGNLQSFFNNVWKIKMRIVLKNLEKEDIERYDTGRRQMGVVMETVSEEKMDDESEEETDDEVEDNGIQGSYHEAVTQAVKIMMMMK